MVQKESIIKCFKNCGFHRNDTNVNESKELYINIEEFDNISKIIGINSESLVVEENVPELKEDTPDELMAYLINKMYDMAMTRIVVMIMKVICVMG